MGGELSRSTKKIKKGKNLGKKLFTASSLEKNSCIDIPKYFTEILVRCTIEQIRVNTSVVKNMPSFLASVQSGCLFKTTF